LVTKKRVNLPTVDFAIVLARKSQRLLDQPMPSTEMTKVIVDEVNPASQRNYREFRPEPFFAASVECFWISTVFTVPRTPSFHRVLPDGCMDLLFDFSALGSQRASVIGTMTRPLTFTTTGPVDLFGVRFRPGGLSRFMTLNAAELTDAQADLTNFWGPLAEEIWHRLADANPTKRMSLLQEILRKRGNQRPQTDPYLHHCVTRIEEARGSARIDDLENSTGLSGRQLERKFARALGVSPKTFARIVRFKAVAAAVASSDPPTWVQLANDFEFADQPHLAREFKAFSGLRPTDYARAANQPG
jgi:AraC-like DNA-binding protein